MVRGSLLPNLKIRTDLAVRWSLHPNLKTRTDSAVRGSLLPNRKIRIDLADHGSLHPNLEMQTIFLTNEINLLGDYPPVFKDKNENVGIYPPKKVPQGSPPLFPFPLKNRGD